MSASKPKSNVDFQQIVDLIPQTIMVLDARGTVIYANQAVLNYTGLTVANVMKPDLERELRQLVDSLPQHVLVLDVNGSILQVNRMMLDYLGRTLNRRAHCETNEDQDAAYERNERVQPHPKYRVTIPGPDDR